MAIEMQNLMADSQQARDVATQLDSIIDEISSELDALDKDMDDVNAQTEAQWQTNLNSDWKSFKANQVPSAISALRGQATNLRATADAADRVSQG